SRSGGAPVDLLHRQRSFSGTKGRFCPVTYCLPRAFANAAGQIAPPLTDRSPPCLSSRLTCGGGFMHGTANSSGGKAGGGIGYPRLYDFLVFLLTRGRESAYRERLLDVAGIAPDQRFLDIGC